MTDRSIVGEIELARGVLSSDGGARATFLLRFRAPLSRGFVEGADFWGDLEISKTAFALHVAKKACEGFLRVVERTRGGPGSVLPGDVSSGDVSSGRALPGGVPRNGVVRETSLDPVSGCLGSGSGGAGPESARPESAGAESGLGSFLENLSLVDLYLALACALGRDAAWVRFDRAYGEFLRRSSHLLLRRRDHADEVVDSFYGDLYVPRSGTGLKNALFHYGGRARLKTWLRSILFFRIRDYCAESRREPRMVSCLDTIESNPGSGGGEPGRFAVQERPNPEQQTDREFLLEAVSSSLPGGFSSLDREELWLLREYYENGKTVEEIGRELGVHRATISRRLKRIHGKLYARVSELLAFEFELETELTERAAELDLLLRNLARRFDFESVLAERDR